MPKKMPKKMLFRFELDMGSHMLSFLQVHIHELCELGIMHIISPFSYYDMLSGNAYLKEPCDSNKYVNTIGSEKALVYTVSISDGYEFLQRLTKFGFEAIKKESKGDKNANRN